eukprot:m.77621 g.77621  ORF g.77621 m.77621 type:complete len:530 (+) comp14476_c0_seq1:177-1766(+)
MMRSTTLCSLFALCTVVTCISSTTPDGSGSGSGSGIGTFATIDSSARTTTSPQANATTTEQGSGSGAATLTMTTAILTTSGGASSAPPSLSPLRSSSATTTLRSTLRSTTTANDSGGSGSGTILIVSSSSSRTVDGSTTGSSSTTTFASSTTGLPSSSSFASVTIQSSSTTTTARTSTASTLTTESGESGSGDVSTAFSTSSSSSLPASTSTTITTTTQPWVVPITLSFEDRAPDSFTSSDHLVIRNTVANLLAVALDRVRLTRILALSRRRAEGSQLDLAILDFSSQAAADKAAASANDAGAIEVFGVGTAQVSATAARLQTEDDELEDRDLSPPLVNDSTKDKGTNPGLIAGISVLAVLLILVILTLIYVQNKRTHGQIDFEDIIATSPHHNNEEDGVTTSAYHPRSTSTRAWPQSLNASVASYKQPKRVLSRALATGDDQPMWFPGSPPPYKTRERSFVQGPAPVTSPGRYADGRLPVYLTDAKQGWGVLSSPAVKPQVMHVTRHGSSESQEALLEEGRPVNMYAL